MINLSNLAAILTASSKNNGLKEAVEIGQAESKRVLGTYDYGWPQLADSTLARKANGNTPLVETGAMRESIQTAVGADSAEWGSNDPNAVRHEFGTRKMPPRPFFSPAAMAKQKEIEDAIGNALMQVFRP